MAVSEREPTVAPPHSRVWDPFVRFFHWSLVAAFATAFLTEDSSTVHVLAGYAVGVLVAARIAWGFVGPAHARFAGFVYAPGTVVRYVRDLVTFRGGTRYLGHSPGGGAMVIGLLLCLVALVSTGLVVLGGEQQAGPLAGLVSARTAEAVEDWHEVIANITLALVLVHVAAVVLASFSHRENLVRAMVTGRKKPLATTDSAEFDDEVTPSSRIEPR